MDGLSPPSVVGLRCLLLFALLSPAISQAQTTGKLAGRVTDATTGAALIGANILLTNSSVGTVSGDNGHFTLLGLPVGTYDVAVSYVGYQTQSLSGVTIHAGSTRELEVSLEPGVEFEHVTIQYERPLIQKDAVGVPRRVSAEEIVHLPARGIEAVAGLQAGVLRIRGREDMFVRGGRSRDVAIYVDGVRIVPNREPAASESGLTSVIGIPQSAIQEQEMLIGNISARYGDVMSGVVNIVTKSGQPNYFGSLEAISSHGLDAYGSRLFSGSIGGPLWGDRMSFFVSGEYSRDDDGAPRSVEVLRVDANELERLRRNPQSIRVRNADGSEEYVELPGDIEVGATVPLDEDGDVLVDEEGIVTLSDGSIVQLSGPDATPFFTPILGFTVVDPDLFHPERARQGTSRSVSSSTANITIRPSDSGRLRVGGRYADVRSQRLTPIRMLFAPETFIRTKDRQWQTFASYTHYLSGSTLIQGQFDYSDRKAVSHDPRFSDNVEDILFYGDLDHPANAVNARYKGLGETDGQPTFVPLFRDGDILPTQTIAWPGGINERYLQIRFQQWRASALATAQIGLHQLEVGGEFEQRTRRRWSMHFLNAHRLAGWYDDTENCSVGGCGPEQSTDGDGDGEPDPVRGYADLPSQAINLLDYYGYDFRGLNEVSDHDFGGLVTGKNLDVAPWRPRYYGGYVQDKIEFDDLIVNLGLRVDVFDNNTPVLRDRFARAPIVRAGELVERPASVSSDYAVYFDGDDVVGYRDLDGRFYDSRGQESLPVDVLVLGTPRLVEFGGDDNLRAAAWRAAFDDYKPDVNVMPRVGVSFPVTDRGLVYGSYGIVSQRPGTLNYPSIRTLLDPRVTAVPNPGLKSETTTNYEIGYRHRVARNAALSISGFFKQIKDMERFRWVERAFPNTYTTVLNEDFGTVKGFEFDFQLRRTKSIAISANYTLSFAEGTGSDALSNQTGVAALTPSRTVFPLDFDSRHAVNGSVDIRFGDGQGPVVGSIHVLEHFGINVLAQAATGLPFTLRAFQGDFRRDGFAAGPTNSSRMQATGTVDFRADRRIPLGREAWASVFLWVTNVFDWENVFDVHNATGQPNSDGFLITPVGLDWLADQAVPETAAILYDHVANDPEFYGLPRQIRVGLRVTY